MITNGLGATVNVTAPASISVTPSSGIAPLTVSASIAGTVPPGASGYSWNWGDGSAAVFNDIPTTMQHTYSKPGSYSVSVTIQDVNGATLKTLSGLGVISGTNWLYLAGAGVIGLFFYRRKKSRRSRK